MMTDPTAALLPDGRLHLQHGPIDVIVSADGSEAAVEAGGGAWHEQSGPLLQHIPP